MNVWMGLTSATLMLSVLILMEAIYVCVMMDMQEMDTTAPVHNIVAYISIPLIIIHNVNFKCNMQFPIQ